MNFLKLSDSYINFDQVQTFIESDGQTKIVFENDSEFNVGYMLVSESAETIYNMLKKED